MIAKMLVESTIKSRASSRNERVTYVLQIGAQTKGLKERRLRKSFGEKRSELTFARS